jgi:hypothetical protein
MQNESCDQTAAAQPLHVNKTPQSDPALQDQASSNSSSAPLFPDTCPAFPRLPAETPRAFSAFRAFFDLGHSRSLQSVADHLGEKLDTIKKWSSRFRWSDRIHSFNAGCLQHAAATEAARRSEESADWARRTARHREHEWETAQKLLAAIECFLDDFSDRDVERMTLAQVSRAFQVASSIARSTLSGSLAPEQPTMAPIQIELTAALKKAYGQPPAEPSGGRPSSGAATNESPVV